MLISHNVPVADLLVDRRVVDQGADLSRLGLQIGEVVSLAWRLPKVGLAPHYAIVHSLQVLVDAPSVLTEERFAVRFRAHSVLVRRHTHVLGFIHRGAAAKSRNPTTWVRQAACAMQSAQVLLSQHLLGLLHLEV